jgi:cytochrome c2
MTTMPTRPRNSILYRLSFALLCAVVSSSAQAEGDPAAGKRVFTKCAICHTAEPGKNKIGPTLYDVLGRDAGAIGDYGYSPAMREFKKAWAPELLDAYLKNPRAVVPGTKMTFPGIANDRERDDLISYLATLH